MVDKQQPITKDGLVKIEEELAFLETVRRRDVSEKIHQAKELSNLKLSSGAVLTETKVPWQYKPCDFVYESNPVHPAHGGWCP